jgi:hypothetical protein
VPTRAATAPAHVPSSALGAQVLPLFANRALHPYFAALPLALSGASFITMFSALVATTNDTVMQLGRHSAGAINGVIISIVALAMAVGPGAAAPIFAAAIAAWPAPPAPSSPFAILLCGASLVILGFSAILLVMAGSATIWPLSLGERRRREQKRAASLRAHLLNASRTVDAASADAHEVGG